MLQTDSVLKSHSLAMLDTQKCVQRYFIFVHNDNLKGFYINRDPGKTGVDFINYLHFYALDKQSCAKSVFSCAVTL